MAWAGATAILFASTMEAAGRYSQLLEAVEFPVLDNLVGIEDASVHGNIDAGRQESEPRGHMAAPKLPPAGRREPLY